jgi:hypothetical protein
VPEDNLMLKLVGLLNTPSWIWLPAGLVTTISLIVYVTSIYQQVSKAYLWPNNDRVRTIITSIFYLSLCTLMAALVLMSALTRSIHLADIWACFLIAVFSLAGIGWSQPASWVESMGIKSPDYTKGRNYAEQLSNILLEVRKKKRSEKKDVDEFLAAAKGLKSNIDTNISIEPTWARNNLEEVKDTLYELINEIKTQFPENEPDKIEYFASACRCQQKTYYQTFIDKLERLGNFWQSWQCP